MTKVFTEFPYLILIAAIAVMFMSITVVVITKYFDGSKGVLAISLLIVMSFILATFASMVYEIKQTPLTEILVGGLATGLGGVISFYLGRRDNSGSNDHD
jgi:hypothetical protein